MSYFKEKTKQYFRPLTKRSAKWFILAAFIISLVMVIVEQH